jgi:hypothetical protein
MCVFKYHAFIYFLRPPPWYGTGTPSIGIDRSIKLGNFGKLFLHKVTLEPVNQHRNWQSVGISVFTENEAEVGRFLVAMAKHRKDLAIFLFNLWSKGPKTKFILFFINSVVINGRTGSDSINRYYRSCFTLMVSIHWLKILEFCLIVSIIGKNTNFSFFFLVLQRAFSILFVQYLDVTGGI